MNNDEFNLEKVIYDLYCCRYPNFICKINKKILAFALEYASLRGKMGGIALVDIEYKEIFSIIEMDSITCISSISENKFFACSYNRKIKKRYLKEFEMKEDLNKIGEIEIYHFDDIINIEIINESDLMLIGSDEGKINVFDNYSVIENNSQIGQK